MEKVIFNSDLGAGQSSHFEDLYFLLSKEIKDRGNFVGSRNGNTVEFLNFKTIVGNPIARCVGGYKRDINVFFLLAEAMWIFTGRKDVEFLTIFNSRMSEFSDDGKNFHAPYGFRLRHWGISSFDKSINEGSNHYLMGRDQLFDAIWALAENREDRRVVMSIWNPDLDLLTKSKDLPCNDMIMFKIREGKLFQTIQNRSNDLHWGLPTNVFQFSFIGEVISKILNVGLGDQVHNSQSLHCYLSNELTEKMHNNVSNSESPTLYEDYTYSHMDFNWGGSQLPYDRLKLVDNTFDAIIERLTKEHNMSEDAFDAEEEVEFCNSLHNISPYFEMVYDILSVYVTYSKTPRKDFDRLNALEKLITLKRRGLCADYIALSMNFFISRIKSPIPDSLLSSYSSSLGKM